MKKEFSPTVVQVLAKSRTFPTIPSQQRVAHALLKAYPLKAMCKRSIDTMQDPATNRGTTTTLVQPSLLPSAYSAIEIALKPYVPDSGALPFH